MLDFRPMEITLRAPGTPIDALTLEDGLHAIGPAPDGGLRRVDGSGGDARVWIRVDRCGTWLAVVDGVRGVHVNGRPVRRCALLRAGDSVHVDGSEIVLTAPVAAAGEGAVAKAPQAGDATDPRLVLRGLGGRHHGRSYTLGQARSLGSARIGWEGGRVLLRAGGDEAVSVNGIACREAVLRPGDQLAFAGGQRFVVEAPVAAAAIAASEAAAGADPVEDGPVDDGLRPTARRLPLLLVAALLLAAALSALLLL
jgi:hypothetical protein